VNGEFAKAPIPRVTDIATCEPVVLAVMPSIPIGGMERANIEVFRLLKKHGARVVVLTRQGYGDRVHKACANHGIETRPVSVHCDPRFPRGPIELVKYVMAWYRFAREVSRARRELHPQWLYITNLTYFFYSWPILAFAEQGVVFNLPIPPDAPRGRAKAMLVRWLWRRLVTPLCTHITCNSRFTLNRLLATGSRPKSVSVVHNSLPSRSKPTTKLLLPGQEGQLKISYVGRLAASKGVGALFEAAVRIARERADVDFYFAGDYRWQNPFATELVKRTAEYSLEDRIFFLGELEDVPGLLSQSDLHVLFSDEEAFGLVVLEAKNQGVPSVVSPGGALPELVTHLEDGYVCRESTATSLREGLEFFLADPAARRRAGVAAFQSMDRFKKEKIGSQWATLMDLC
jgi:glycosyltransferase involved in cell wall biosynthesis